MINNSSRNRLTSIFATIGTSLLLAAQSQASVGTAIQLYNTGVNGIGGQLPNATADSHYALISAPGAYATAYTGNGSDVYPWLADGPNSRWIGASTWLNEWLPSGNYVYRTTFDLSGMIPSSASISLKLASDDVCDVFLNGVATGIATSSFGFTNFSAFSITTGFINGVNTLDFRVNNGDVPPSNRTGLRTELSGYAVIVPEPASAALVGFGGILLVALRRKPSV